MALEREILYVTYISICSYVYTIYKDIVDRMPTPFSGSTLSAGRTGLNACSAFLTLAGFKTQLPASCIDR